MDQDTGSAPQGGNETPTIAPVTLPTSAPPAMTATEAGRALAQARIAKRNATTEQPQAQAAAPVEAAAAEPVTQLADEANAGEVETLPPGEIEAADPALLPPIEPPRSWTKDDKELFNGLPRETQERLAERERSRDSDFSRRQQEATEKSKALEAERSKVEQARSQYETALPILLQNLQAQLSGEFADLKTMADVQKMAAEDWPRYVRWDAQQKQIAAVQQEVSTAGQRQISEKQTKLAEFVKREAELFAEKVPEMADEAKKTKLQSSAVALLKDVGFSQDEQAQLWRGEKDISIHDHRFQSLLLDGIRYREAQQRAKAAATKPVPPVQRPGVAQPRSAGLDATIQALTAKLNRTGNAKDAAALLAAQRQARARSN